jgi:hypothetical protein
MEQAVFDVIPDESGGYPSEAPGGYAHKYSHPSFSQRPYQVAPQQPLGRYVKMSPVSSRSSFPVRYSGSERQ